jgi:hypothetical protein
MKPKTVTAATIAYVQWNPPRDQQMTAVVLFGVGAYVAVSG